MLDHCPPHDALRQVAVGLLSGQQADEIERHLLECAPCVERLNSLDARDALIEGLQGNAAPRRDTLAAADLESLIARVQAAAGTNPPTAPVDAVGVQRQAVAIDQRRYWQDLLAPPEAPDELGRLGRFRALSVLGAGGMGVVLKAHDPKLGRTVALKVPRPELLVSERMRQRFLREARAASAVSHENVVPLYEIGEVGTLIYLAMACCDGPTLAEWLHQQVQPVSVRLACQMTASLADAAAQAHASGVLHRDIKPANVLLDPSARANGDAGLERTAFTPKLTDFGLARLADESSGATQGHTLAGTPAYMAPEQVEARPEGVGPAADVYGLGCVLYELLVGRPPFGGAFDADTLRQVILSEPPPPRRLRRDVPRDVEAIVLRCLEKQPARRYASAAALADDLRRYLAGQATEARPLTFGQRTLRWVRRRPALAALAVVSVAAVAALLGLNAWRIADLNTSLAQQKELSGHAKRQETAAVAQRDVASVLLYAANMRLAQNAVEATDLGLARTLLARYADGTDEAHLRGFEWHYLDRLCNLDRLTLRGHQGEVYRACFSPDGKTVISGGQDGTLRFWDAQTGKLLESIRAHSSCLNSISLAPVADLMATASCDTTVKLWRLSTRSELATLARHTAAVDTCDLSRDGAYLATDQEGGDTIVWDLVDRKPIATLPESGGKNQFPLFSPDGKWLVTALGGKTKLWRFASGHCEQHVEAPFKSLGVDFAPDSKTLAVSLESGKLRILNVPDLTTLKELPGHANTGFAVRYSPDGRSLASMGADSILRIWDVPDGREINRLTGHAKWAPQVDWSPDGKEIVTASLDGTVKLWDPLVADRRVLTPPREGIRQGAFLHGRNCFAGLSDEECVWNLQTGERMSLDRWPRTTAVDRASVQSDREFPLEGVRSWQDWDLATHRSFPQVEWSARPGTPAQTVSVQEFVDGGRQVLNIDRKWNYRLWSSSTGRLQQARQLRRKWPRIYAVSPDGRLLVVGDYEKPVELFDVAKGQVVLRLGNADGSDGATFSPDVRLLVVMTADGAAVWDVERREIRYRLHGAGRVVWATFSPDGRRIATSANQSARLWDAVNGQELLRLSGTAIDAVLFSRDGRSLVSVGNAGEAGIQVVYWPSRHDRGPRGEESR